MESNPRTTPAAARTALTELASAQARIADRVASPLWYRLGAGLSTSCLFLGMGLLVGRPDPGGAAEMTSSLLIVLGACVAPSALLWGLTRSTGVSLDRYSHGMTGWYVTMFALLGVGFVLQAALEVPYALAVAAVIAFPVTVVNERRLDVALQDRVRAGGSPQ